MSALAHRRPAAPQQSLSPAPDPEHQLRALDESPCWPKTRLVGWSLTLALGIGVLGPVGIMTGDWAALLVPTIVTTLSVRALFEMLAFTAPPGRRLRHLLPALPAALLALVLVSGSAAVLGDGFDLSASFVTALLGMVVLFTAASARDLEIRLRLGLRRVYFVGSTDSRRELERELGRRHDARLVGAAGRGDPTDATRLVHAVLASRATVLVLDGTAMNTPAVVEGASRLNVAGVRVRELVSYYEAEFKKVPLTELTPTWFLFDIAPIHRRAGFRALRRAAELVAAGALLVCSLPVLVAAAVAIKLTSPGPVIYRQRRVGKGGSHFTLVKLRTMAAGPGSGVWASSETERVTPVGSLLRRYRIDELPQLVNVLKGDLALIGPRPEQVPIAARLEAELPHYGVRHSIRPGLTGWAQVNLGYAGSLGGTLAKLQRDLYYVKHSSLRLDLLILWLTFKTLIAGRG
jgi:lipopolysaccharide/colanic/teichoic acid biosynthesis glycosyltransferase